MQLPMRRKGKLPRPPCGDGHFLFGLRPFAVRPADKVIPLPRRRRERERIFYMIGMRVAFCIRPAVQKIGDIIKDEGEVRAHGDVLRALRVDRPDGGARSLLRPAFKQITPRRERREHDGVVLYRIFLRQPLRRDPFGQQICDGVFLQNKPRRYGAIPLRRKRCAQLLFPQIPALKGVSALRLGLRERYFFALFAGDGGRRRARTVFAQ